MKGSMIRTSALYVEINEKNSKYFLKLEQNNSAIKYIECVQKDDGKFITWPYKNI